MTALCSAVASVTIPSLTGGPVTAKTVLILAVYTLNSKQELGLKWTTFFKEVHTKQIQHKKTILFHALETFTGGKDPLVRARCGLIRVPELVRKLFMNSQSLTETRPLSVAVVPMETN